jgi:hypothetical protein
MDPADLREVISAYQKCVADTVLRFGGFVAKMGREHHSDLAALGVGAWSGRRDLQRAALAEALRDRPAARMADARDHQLRSGCA